MVRSARGSRRRPFNATTGAWLTLAMGLLLPDAHAWAQEANAAGLRSRLLLRDGWRTAVTKDASQTAPAEGWRPAAVPSTQWLMPEGGSNYAWYRCDVQIPAQWAGRRVFVTVRAANFAPHLYVDGKPAGWQMSGWSPLEVEITQFVQPGNTHRLELRCQDRGATFPEGFTLPPGTSADRAQGKTLAPVGGHRGAVGPWQPIWLESRPQARLLDSELVIATSTRKGTLTLSGKVDAPAAQQDAQDLWVQAAVLDQGVEILRVEPTQASTGDWTLTAPAQALRHWSPEDPHLYTLRLTLQRGKSGPVLDVIEKRFGFKEFWTDGPDFYLNGIKRHLLATSTWPITQYEDLDTIRQKVRTIKAANIVAFRLHIGPWQEEWLDAADEVGLLIIQEAAVYTDGDGFYGYRDERFWQNYRDHVAGMIRRDRNHASLIMWSLGNEILFMGNQRHDPDLPRKQGDLGRFAKALDPHHPIIFEADLDPDGAYDVIGLHYPHELPDQHAYPNICDWLDREKQTEAGGGMLGQRSSRFSWDRKKPLYIGEYLWVPQADYGPGSVFFGDEAYLNREEYRQQAQIRAWVDQTIAYRRAGVSGLCPWSPLAFGGGVGNQDAFDAHRGFYAPVAAFRREKYARLFAGQSLPMTFDVFNDSARSLDLELRLVHDRQVVGSQSLKLDPAAHQSVSLSFAAPQNLLAGTITVESILLAGGKEVHRQAHELSVVPQFTPQAPAGKQLIAYDPTGKWPGSVASLESLKEADPASAIVLVCPDALSTPAVREAGALPAVGGPQFDAAGFLAFLRRGGRAVVLEQQTLLPLGLNLSLVDHASTMTFPLSQSHPLLQGLAPDDLKFWRPDHYVAMKQIRRPEAEGASAVVVSGGRRSLDQAAVVEMPVGSGYVVLIQALVGQKLSTEPAAARLLGNALHYVAARPAAPAQPTLLISDNDAFAQSLTDLGIAFERATRPLAAEDAQRASCLILRGGGDVLTNSGPAIAAILQAGGTVYWHAPDPVAYDALRIALGGAAADLRVGDTPAGVSIHQREHALLRGVSREDLTYTTRPQGWDRIIDHLPTTSIRQFLPRTLASDSTPSPAEEGRGEDTRPQTQPAAPSGMGAPPMRPSPSPGTPGEGRGEGASLPLPLGEGRGEGMRPQATLKIDLATTQFTGATLRDATDATGQVLVFDRRGTVRATVEVSAPGLYPLTIRASGTSENNQYPLLRVDVAEVAATWLALSSDEMRDYPTLIALPAGKSQIAVTFTNGSQWGGGRKLTLAALQLGSAAVYPTGVDVLVTPAALVSLSAGQGTLVLDGINWPDADEANAPKARRYASALLRNLGVSFTAPTQTGRTFEPLPLSAFRLIGQSPYYNATPDELTMRTKATVEADFHCAAAGSYVLRLEGSSSPVRDTYAKVQITVDDQEAGVVEVASATPRPFDAPTPLTLTPGRHRLRLSFINDEAANGQDRNLFLRGVAMQKQ